MAITFFLSVQSAQLNEKRFTKLDETTRKQARSPGMIFVSITTLSFSCLAMVFASSHLVEALKALNMKVSISEDALGVTCMGSIILAIEQFVGAIQEGCSTGGWLYALMWSCNTPLSYFFLLPLAVLTSYVPRVVRYLGIELSELSMLCLTISIVNYMIPSKPFRW